MATSVEREYIKRGDTWKATLSWFDGAYPLDLTGATVRLQLRTKKVYSVVLDVSTASGELTVPEPLNGQVKLEVPAATMEAIAPSVYWCDGQATLADGSVQSSATFEVEVHQDITYDDA